MYTGLYNGSTSYCSNYLLSDIIFQNPGKISVLYLKTKAGKANN